MRLSDAYGVSLLEVLIALLVLSVGILGAVGLQLVSKRNTLDADQRSIASHLAYDLVERIRSNNTQQALEAYAQPRVLGRGAMGDAPGVDCRSADCSPLQLALFDLWHWEQALDGALEALNEDASPVGGLAQPTACLSGPGDGANGVYSLTIAWRGAAPLPPVENNDCGAGLELYGEDGRFRHLLALQAYVVSR